MDLEKEERRRDRKVKRMKVKMFVDYPSHLTWSTLGVLSACSFETRILTMLSKNIKLIFKKSFGHILPCPFKNLRHKRPALGRRSDRRGEATVTTRSSSCPPPSSRSSTRRSPWSRSGRAPWRPPRLRQIPEASLICLQNIISAKYYSAHA